MTEETEETEALKKTRVVVARVVGGSTVKPVDVALVALVEAVEAVAPAEVVRVSEVEAETE